MSRTFTLTGPAEEVGHGLRQAISEGPVTWRVLDDEIFSVAEFPQPPDELLEGLVVSAARILDREMVVASLGSPISSDLVACRQLASKAVQLLARIDDTRLRVLCESVWESLENSAEPDPDWTQSVRTLVIQARSAVANGWHVYVFAEPEPS